jgi:ABC-type molybdate transport system ATPase subunit
MQPIPNFIVLNKNDPRKSVVSTEWEKRNTKYVSQEATLFDHSLTQRNIMI